MTFRLPVLGREIAGIAPDPHHSSNHVLFERNPMPQYFDGATAQNPFPPYEITTLGSFQLKTAGGCLTGPVNVKTAGSADAVIQLFDGTSASGQLIATVGFGSAGPWRIPNQSFVNGLFVVASGTTAGTAQITFN